jgi:predicted short-subunit dehydrogenase-like oxidoreductase (DUF2520 family)
MSILKRFGDDGMNVSFIGAGNLAWHLAPALDNTDFAVKEVYSQTRKHAAALVDRLYQAEIKSTLDFSTSPSKIFIIVVSDDVIEDIAGDVILPPNAILVHTSGSQPLSVLGYASTLNIGVLYPLQTFTKVKKIDFKDVPIFIESENPETEKILMSMAKAISKNVSKITSQKRKALHVAAVFAANFVNHMLTLSQEILEKNDLDFKLLKPLIVEQLNKSLEIGPDRAQTGPAFRGDVEILDKHFQFLDDDPEVGEIYKIVSQHILDRYNE